MNIMVFDVAAQSGGALTILNQFYDTVKNNKNKNITWYFVLSLPNLKSDKNIHILRFPWIKKSWLSRLYFDKFIAKKLVKKCKIDHVFSLQNIPVSGINVPQSVYIHQSIPFSDIKFSLLKEPALWIYKNILSKSILSSAKKAKNIIFQTNWMKEAFLKKANADADKIYVFPPNTDFSKIQKYNDSKTSRSTFFYPANDSSYKNYEVLFEALSILKTQNFSEYKLILTLSKDSHYQKLSEQNGFPVLFKGHLAIEEVYETYANSVLVFPSLLETFGLPLLEAKCTGSFILASDLPFSREILKNYPNALFFDPKNANDLASKMHYIIEDVPFYKTESDKLIENSWEKVIAILINK